MEIYAALKLSKYTTVPGTEALTTSNHSPMKLINMHTHTHTTQHMHARTLTYTWAHRKNVVLRKIHQRKKKTFAETLSPTCMWSSMTVRNSLPSVEDTSRRWSRSLISYTNSSCWACVMVSHNPLSPPCSCGPEPCCGASGTGGAGTLRWTLCWGLESAQTWRKKQILWGVL